jgi:enolase-phosphatase E1
MDRDRKSTGLKALQGRVWEEAFHAGTLRGMVYPDIPPAFRRWRAQGREIAIFSSGSVRAQQLLFASAPPGDLAGFLRGYFDTTVGPKREAASYRRIAEALALPPEQVLFVSDVAAELDAARAAGLHTVLCVREGPLPDASPHPAVDTFDDVCP